MSKTLLVGAGAECIEPFGLLAGKEFTFDTCYYQNEALYEALEEFYRGRLSKVQIGIQELLPLIKICFSTRPKTWRFASCPTISSVPLWIHF